MKLQDITIRSFHDGLIMGDFSAEEITKEFLNEIKNKDEELGAYLKTEDESALLEARRVDEIKEEKNELPLMAGVPLAIKDNILIEGTRTTAASKILENYYASYDSTVISKLKNEHAVFLGKTNLDEFAMGASTENSAFKTTKNPYDHTRVPGGSSGGSAVAVSAGLAVAAIGSDTAGSIRQPSAFCGIVGLKPTYGAVSRFGLIAMASSLDQIGPMTKTVEDAAMLYDVIKGYDAHDATSSPDIQPPTDKLDEDKTKKLVVGVPSNFFDSGLDKEVEKEIDNAMKKMKKIGFSFKEIELPNIKYSISTYYIISPAEVSTNLARFDGIRYSRNKSESKKLSDIYFETRGNGFGGEVRRRILLGTFVLSSGYYDAYYGKAQKVRQLIKEDFEKVFKKPNGVDVIFMPTTPTRAFKIGEKASDPLSMYLSDIFTASANLAGLPAISIPVKKYSIDEKELPVGFQLIGKPFHEKDILSIGMLYEKK